MMPLQRNRAAVRRFAGMMKFAGWLQRLPDRVTPPPFRLMQIGSAFWQSRALYVAARLDVATRLGDRHLTADEIAALVLAQPDALYRLLRMLAAIGVFEEVSPRVFANNRLSAPLRDDHPDGVRAIILLHHSDEMSRPWGEQLERCVREGGIPFQRTHGAALFDYMDQHPAFDALFAQAMDHVEALSGDSFVRDFDWSRFRRVIDMGGSRGSKAIAILKRHPHLHALVVDRAQVIQGAAGHWQGDVAPSVLARLRFQAGNLLESAPMAINDQDIYLLSAVFHGFDDPTCIQALRNLARACGGTGARIALLEMVMAESRADLACAAFDMQMFMGTRGRERTLGEWQRVFDEGGCVLEEQVNLQSFVRMLVLQVKPEAG